MDMTEAFKDRDSFAHWFIIAALKNVEINDKLRTSPKKITMQINGEEVNPSHALMRVEEEFNRLVKVKSAELVDEMKDEIYSPFKEKVEEMTEALDGLINKKLIPSE